MYLIIDCKTLPLVLFFFYNLCCSDLCGCKISRRFPVSLRIEMFTNMVWGVENISIFAFFAIRQCMITTCS